MKEIFFLLGGLALFAFKPQAQSTVTDYDGNVYNTVAIGTQVWMQENLRTTHYHNGDLIPNVPDHAGWGNQAAGARCYYNNDSVVYASVYGVLYNWFAVSDSRNLCPVNWHVPTDAEWTALSDYLGGTGFAGGKMKEAGTSHWLEPNIEATNESGFTALPGGYRPHDDGIFEGIHGFGYWWSATEYNSNSAWDRNIYNASASIYPYYDDGKGYGFSVRCVRNSPANVPNDHQDNQDIRFYPNPANERLQIEYREREEAKILVYNLSGVCVLQSTLTNGTNDIVVSTLPNGVYFIRITGKTRRTDQILIKE